MRLPFLVPLLFPAMVAAQEDVPCTEVRSMLHGVLLVSARAPSVGGPPCDVLQAYRQWLESSDTLRTGRRQRDVRFTGREWDFATAAMRVGAPAKLVMIRGDSLSPFVPGQPRRLHLSAFAAEPPLAAVWRGSWFVLVDTDSVDTRLFRSPVTARRLHAVLEDRGSLVYAIGGVRVDGTRVRAQLAEARSLRAALGFTDAMPAARFVIGRATDSTLAQIGVTRMSRPLVAMMVEPPLAVFAPLTPTGGLDPHELVHVATLGRREVIPGSVGEAFAMHHGGSHGRPFGEAFCASRAIRSLPPLTTAQLDSAFDGHWWDDDRADVSGFALGHAMGWFIAQRGDSAWVFADGEPARDNDAIGFLARRSGMTRADAMARITESYEARRVACPTPPSAAAAVPAPGSR